MLLTELLSYKPACSALNTEQSTTESKFYLTSLRVLLDLSSEVLNQKVEGVLRVSLGLLEVGSLILELVEQLLEHLHDPAAAELVRVGLGGFV
jgi:hypothetical protein